METQFQYFGFISYSRKDIKAATFLQNNIEHFRYDKRITSSKIHLADKKYLRPIFLDRTDLIVDEREFSIELNQNLERSKYLIVLCTESSAISKYVADEINHFLKTHNDDYSLIIPVLLGSDIKAILPMQLQKPAFLERNLPNMNNENRDGSNEEWWENGVQQCISYMLDIPFPLIARRYQKEKSRALKITLIWVCIIAILFAGISVLSFYSLQKAKESENNAKNLAVFEKSIFPLSLVFGYVDNFLVHIAKSKPSSAIILILPKDYSELDQAKKVRMYKNFLINNEFNIQEEITTQTQAGQRGRNILRILPKENEAFKCDVYIDFASTVTAFKGVIDYKKKNSTYYQNVDVDEIIENYSKTFEEQIVSYMESVKDDDELIFSPSEQLFFATTPEEFGVLLDSMVAK